MSTQHLSRRVRELPPSETLAMAARARQLRAQGKAVIDFSVGEPDFVSPAAAAEGARAAIERGDTHYPPVGGTVELKAAIQARVKADSGREVTGEQVLVSNGAKQVLYNLMQALLDPGDEVVYASPYWVSYPAMAQLAGGRGVPIPTRAEEGFRLAPEAVEAALGSRCKALILNSPSNPTGAVMAPEDVDAVVGLALERDKIVISDEIYAELIFEGRHRSVLAIDHPRAATNLVLVDGVSKSHAMTGWRIGYAVGPAALISAASKIQGQSTSGACSIAQAAAAAAITRGAAAAAEMKAAFARRRGLVLELLGRIPGAKVAGAQGAFYVFPDLSAYYGSRVDGREITGSTSLCELLIDEAHVATVAGAAFGADAHIRLSYALAEEQLREGLERIRALLARATPGPA